MTTTQVTRDSGFGNEAREHRRKGEIHGLFRMCPTCDCGKDCTFLGWMLDGR